MDMVARPMWKHIMKPVGTYMSRRSDRKQYRSAADLIRGGIPAAALPGRREVVTYVLSRGRIPANTIFPPNTADHLALNIAQAAYNARTPDQQMKMQ